MKNQSKSKSVPLKKTSSNKKLGISFTNNKVVLVIVAILLFAAFGAFGYKLLHSTNSSDALSVTAKYNYPTITSVAGQAVNCPDYSPGYVCLNIVAKQMDYAPQQWQADNTLATMFAFRVRIGSDCTSAITSPWQKPSSSSWYPSYWSVVGSYSFKLKTGRTYYYSAKAKDATGKYSKGGTFCGTDGWYPAQYIKL